MVKENLKEGSFKEKKEEEKDWNSKGLREVFRENWLSVILGTVGAVLVLIGAGVMIREGAVESDQEIIIEEETQEGKIKVDIEGAVLKPGVYELPFSSRVQDLLIAAGGLSNNADREWVAKNLNQAAKIKDGEKFYIPKKGEGQVAGSQSAVVGKININRASLSELDTLPDIGKARGQKIIDGRPYSRIEELLERKIIPASVFGQVQDKISVY